MPSAIHLNALDLLLIALAAVATGLVNAIAGGGSLIGFPVLTAVGLELAAMGPVFVASIYSGHFGAGLSVILLAVPGLAQVQPSTDTR
ncbi:hypothetical protein [Cyanobium sp. CH-040]|uniref:hypothetical protein n=1 Tax=Cyanobium sp. CH-040 TaxID=2823708 RepID=UPI0020CB79A1|nr:hypothetical protein [Cyanobium sp. CH-040]MCP9927717.1 hypothetical protein [Cyanobium sp. CH-040]